MVLQTHSDDKGETSFTHRDLWVEGLGKDVSVSQGRDIFISLFNIVQASGLELVIQSTPDIKNYVFLLNSEPINKQTTFWEM